MFITQLFEDDDKELEYGARGAALGAALGAGSTAVDKSVSGKPVKALLGQIGKKAAAAAIPGATIGTSIPEITKYVDQGKYGQAAIAAAGGLSGLIPGVAPGLAGSITATAINACIDDPELCKELGSEIASSIKSPFQSSKESPSPSQRGRGAGRNVLPAQPQQTKEAYDPSITSTKLVLYVNGKAASEYESLYDARKDRDHLRKITPNGNFVIKKVICRVDDKEITENVEVDPKLISAIKDVESGNNPAAVSPKGAMGTMQVMPGTARDPGFGIKPAKDFSPNELERVGQDYYGAMLKKYGGDKKLALIAYNMGPGAADRWLAKGGNYQSLPGETQAYVPKVMSRYKANLEPKSSANANVPTTPSISKSKYSDPVFRKQNIPGYVAPISNIPSATQDSDRVAYNPIGPKGQTLSTKNINPNWTPPPGPKIAPRPQPGSLDTLIKQKDRPESIEDIVRRAKKKQLSKIDALNFANLVANIKDPSDQRIQDFLSKFKDADTDIGADDKVITENMSHMADRLYDRLEITHNDLISLYGHDVFGDAITEILMKHENDSDPDIKQMAGEVIKLLKSKYDEDEITEQDQDQDQDSEIDKDVDHHNAVIQIQADVDKIKNTLGIKEHRIYFNVLATAEKDLREKFYLNKDKVGWYLKENANTSRKLDAIRTFEILKG
jgi:hypothetical protein